MLTCISHQQPVHLGVQLYRLGYFPDPVRKSIGAPRLGLHGYKEVHHSSDAEIFQSGNICIA